MTSAHRAALACVDLAIEAGTPAGVTGGAGLLDPDPDRILIAIGAHLHHALDMARGLALAPQRVAGAAEVPGFSTGDGLAQGFLVHMRDHQHFAARRIGRHAGDETRRVEFGVEGQPLFALSIW